MKAAVIGATGYTGMLLLRFLQIHPEVKEILAVSSSKPGELVAAEDPGLGRNPEKFSLSGGKFLTIEETLALKPDVVFSALPHLASAEVCAPFFGKTVVIDLSADFRIKDRTAFFKAYGQAPPRPDLLDKAVYGLSEWHTEAITTADIIANPGCFTSCSLLPLLPLYRDGIVEKRAIITAVTGISGAGKKLETKNLFAERLESSLGYSPGKKHRHCQEIEAELLQVSPDVDVLFNPQLVPMKRGIAATIVVDLKSGKTLADAENSWNQTFSGRPFVQYTGSRIPSSGDVWGSNRCDFSANQEGAALILHSVLDNLVKGASGQAIQNMNLRFGYPETIGLNVSGQV